MERVAQTYMHCHADSWGEAAAEHREPSPELRDDLGGGVSGREVIYV